MLTVRKYDVSSAGLQWGEESGKLRREAGPGTWLPVAGAINKKALPVSPVNLRKETRGRLLERNRETKGQSQTILWCLKQA